MRDRIIAAVVTAIVHNRKTTIAGLMAVLGLAAAKLGFEVSPEVLVYVAGFIILVVTAAAGDTYRRGLPLLLLGFVLAQTACPKARTVRAVAAATAAACAEFKAEIAADLTPEEAALINPVVDEIRLAADGVRTLSADWDSLGSAERRHLARFAAERIDDALERLSAQGVGIKSERGRRKLAEYLKWGRRAVSALRVIEASLPEPEPTPTRAS